MHIVITRSFNKRVRNFIKKKNYRKIDDDILPAYEAIIAGNLIGEDIQELGLPEGHKVFKEYLPNSSANVGKSNGFRLIYYYDSNQSKVYFLTIYSKKDQEDIENKEIKRLIKLYCT